MRNHTWAHAAGNGADADVDGPMETCGTCTDAEDDADKEDG